MAAEFEKLAYEAALRGLDKQEGQLEEMRARTGILLAASSLAASFLGRAFRDPHPRALALAALLAFVVSMATSVFILMPKENLNFSGAGTGLYEGLFAVRGDMAEIYRRLAYELDCLRDSNDDTIEVLIRAYEIVAIALVIEVISLAALWGDSIF